MYFLAALEPEQRRELIAAGIRHTKTAIATAQRRLRERSKKNVDELQIDAAQGVVYELKARQRWLEWLDQRVAAHSRRLGRRRRPA